MKVEFGGERAFWKWALPVAAGVIVLDRATKQLVLDSPVFHARQCLEPGATAACGKIEMSSLVDLTMVWNYGVSFGMLQSDGLGRWLLLLLSAGISVAFGAWIFRAERRLTAAALALVIGGAVGNMIDRARFGAVVDMVDMSGPWFGWRLPAENGLFAFIDRTFFFPDGVLGIGFPYVYNVADVCITFGAILLFADQILAGRPQSG